MSTIGDLPTPKTKPEYLFVIFELLIGLLTFATVLGYIANIVTNMSAARKDFQGQCLFPLHIFPFLCFFPGLLRSTLWFTSGVRLQETKRMKRMLKHVY